GSSSFNSRDPDFRNRYIQKPQSPDADTNRWEGAPSFHRSPQLTATPSQERAATPLLYRF
ncbi:hypothetical protein ACQKI4_27650, partial [Paenibacillus glucanolyticus]|uniref:hypothetical protein n=1 Tax=Paenibacillus glucanolyticus TaxID=59843 RepID=UPI003D08EAC7